MRKVWIGFILILMLGSGLLIFRSFTPGAGGGADQAIYIDASVGDGGVGSQADPYNNLSDVNWTTGGDNSIFDYLAGSPSESPTIYLAKGQTWREQMTVGASGIEAYPIVVTSYGSGADPIINGSDLVTTWTNVPISGEDFTDDPPIAYWLMEEESGTRYDETAANNDLADGNTVTQSSTHVEGSYSARISSATSEYLSLADASLSAGFPFKNGEVTASFTMGGWFQLMSTPDAGDTLFSKRAGNSGVWLSMVSGKIRVGVFENGGAFEYFYSNDVLAITTWYHVVLRRDNADGAVHLFVNGEDQTASGNIADPLEDAGIFYIGRDPWGGYSDLLVDEFFVFNSKLTDAQILDIKTYGLDGTRNNLTTIYGAACAWTAAQVYEDTTLLTKVTWDTDIDTTAASMSAGTWSLDDANDLLYVWATDDADPDTHVMTVSRRDYGVRAVDKNYITIKDIATQYCNYVGIGFVTSSGTIGNNIIDSCNINYNYQHGFIGYGGTYDHETHIIDCTVHDNGYCGIENAAHSNGSIIEGCTVYDNGISPEFSTGTGIKVELNTTAKNVTIQDNIVYGNGTGTTGIGGGGIHADTAGTGIIIRRNVSYDNTRYGINIEDTDDVEAYYNICYGNGEAGIVLLRSCNDNFIYNNTNYGNAIGIHIWGTQPSVLEDDMTGNLVKNNICSGNTTREFSATYGGENDGTYGSGNVYAYNCFGAEAANFIEWGIGNYDSTYDDWETAYGATTNSVEADPLMTDPASGDFTLQVTSPCIDAGVDVGLIADYVGNPISNVIISPIISIIKSVIKKTFLNPPDIGAYEFGYR